jgi:hypothetical protein
VTQDALNHEFPMRAESAEALVTGEDVLRARDRLKVLQTRSAKRWLRLLWLLAGPGIPGHAGGN